MLEADRVALLHSGSNVNVQLLSSSFNHIDVTVFLEGEDVTWCLTSIYDWPDLWEKWKIG